MRDSFAEKRLSIEKICHCFGISKQGYYKSQASYSKRKEREHHIAEMVIEQRHDLAREGYHKLYKRIKPSLDQCGIKIGRDSFLKVLRNKNLLVLPKKRRYVSTTDSRHPFRIYKNLILDTDAKRSNEIFVSDITYIRVGRKFMYLALITDLYSRKIVGYDFSNSLELEGCVRALKMALKQRKNPKLELIHHSDRGIQYCSYAYTGILKKAGAKISMAAKGNCYENATAERINGILKGEFNLDQRYSTVKSARKSVKQAIDKYNNLRLHMAIGYNTPSQKHVA